jgi:hypothetical protein
MRKFFAYPVMVLSACGILCCLLLAGMIVRGNHAIEKVAPALLFPGIFVVWFPTILVMNGLTRDFKQRDLWEAALRGCPSWMRTMLWITAGLIFFVGFALPFLLGGNPAEFPESFVFFPIIFYAVSFCVMYSAIHAADHDARRCCLNGHRISPIAKFCEECGAPASPSN